MLLFQSSKDYQKSQKSNKALKLTEIMHHHRISHIFAICFVSLGLNCISCRQHVIESCIFIHSTSVCLLTGVFWQEFTFTNVNPFTFKVVTYKLRDYLNLCGQKQHSAIRAQIFNIWRIRYLLLILVPASCVKGTHIQLPAMQREGRGVGGWQMLLC